MEAGKVATTDTAEAVGTETGEQATIESPEKAGTMETAFEGKEGETKTGLEAEAKEPEINIDWDKYGLSNFKGRPLPEIATYLKTQNRLYGKQAQELGELRRIAQEYESMKEQMTGKQAVTVEKQFEKMEDYELAAFANAFNENPLGALQKFILPKLEEPLADKLYERLEKRFAPAIDEKSEDLANKNEFASFAREHPDYKKYSDVMKQLMTEDYIGDTAAYDEAYKLAVMAEKESSLFNETCKLMKREIPFDEAREIALLKQGAAANASAKISQTKKEVASAAVGGKRTATKQATSEPKVTTMDEAFA